MSLITWYFSDGNATEGCLPTPSHWPGPLPFLAPLPSQLHPSSEAPRGQPCGCALGSCSLALHVSGRKGGLSSGYSPQATSGVFLALHTTGNSVPGGQG